MTIRTTLKSAAAVAAAGALALTLGACSSDTTSPSTESSTESLGTLIVGATAVPAGDIVKFVAENLAPAAGLTIEYKEFSDYVTPDTALQEGSIDANLFQHLPYLTDFNEKNGTDLVSVGPVYFPPIALYAAKDGITTLDDIPEGSTIPIPNDATNEGRALQLLANNGLIEVSENPVTVADITSNPKNIVFTELDNPSIPSVLSDSNVYAGVVTAAFALPAGLTGDKIIIAENAEDYAQYFNILAVKAGNENDPRVLKFYELLTSDETKQFIADTWKGQFATN